jgi:hypothetical protein
MKEQSLIEMKNKVEALIRVLQQTVEEQQHLTTLASGIFETIKLMPGYDNAISLLTSRATVGEVRHRSIEEVDTQIKEANKPKELEL